MGRIRILASWALLGLFAVFSPIRGLGAEYGPKNWLLSGGLSYSVMTPHQLNQATSFNGAAAALEGLIGFQLRGERGLGLFKKQYYDWSHWLEAGFYIGGVENAGTSGLVYEKNLSYFATTLGATYWFHKSAYLDFGTSLGVGIAFAPSFSAGTTPGSVAPYQGGVAPVGDLQLNGRLWFTEMFGAYLNLGLRYVRFSFEADGVSAPGPGASWNGLFGVTWAIGGIGGIGRTYVEVLDPKKSP